MQVQQGDGAPLGRGDALGQLELLKGRSGQVLDGHQQALHGPRGAQQACHHQRAMGLAAGGIHQITEQPAAQGRPGPHTHEHQIDPLLKGCAGDAGGHIAVDPQQRLAGTAARGHLGHHLLQPGATGADRRQQLLVGEAGGLHLARRDDQQRQQAALVARGTTAHQAGQGHQIALMVGVGDRHQHPQGTPHQGQLAALIGRVARGGGGGQARHRHAGEPGTQAGGHHHHRQHAVEHAFIEQAAPKAHKRGRQRRRHLGQRQRPQGQHLGAAVAVELAGPPGRQALGGDQGDDQRHRKGRTHHGGGKHRHIEQQPQLDEEDRNEQRRPDKHHLLLDAAIGQHRVHRQARQKGTDDLFNPGHTRPQGRRKQRQQHRHEQLAVAVDAALHDHPPEAGDHHHHQNSVNRHVEQQRHHADHREIAAAHPHAQGQHQQGRNVGEDRAADGHRHRLLAHGAVAAHDRVAQGRVRSQDRADQHGAQGAVTEAQAQCHATGHGQHEGEHSKAQGPLADALELGQIDLQAGDEQQIDHPHIGQQPHRGAAFRKPAQGVGSQQHPRQQQTHQIGQPQAADQRWDQHADRQQQRKGGQRARGQEGSHASRPTGALSSPPGGPPRWSGPGRGRPAGPARASPS